MIKCGGLSRNPVGFWMRLMSLPCPFPHSLLSHLWTIPNFLLSQVFCARGLCGICCFHSLFVCSFVANVSLWAVHFSLRRTSAVSKAPTLPSTPIFHMQTLVGPKSFIKCSGCYDNYEWSTSRYNTSLKKLSHLCTAPQLKCTVIVLDIFWGVLFKKGMFDNRSEAFAVTWNNSVLMGSSERT